MSVGKRLLSQQTFIISWQHLLLCERKNTAEKTKQKKKKEKEKGKEHPKNMLITFTFTRCLLSFFFAFFFSFVLVNIMKNAENQWKLSGLLGNWKIIINSKFVCLKKGIDLFIDIMNKKKTLECFLNFQQRKTKKQRGKWKKFNSKCFSFKKREKCWTGKRKKEKQEKLKEQ